MTDITLIIEELGLSDAISIPNVSDTTLYSYVKRINKQLENNHYDWRVKADRQNNIIFVEHGNYHKNKNKTKTISHQYDTTMSEIGKKIRLARLKKNMSLQELADMTNLTKATLSNYELGKREIKLEQLQIIADILSVPITEFINIGISENRKDEIIRDLLSEYITDITEDGFSTLSCIMTQEELAYYGYDLSQIITA